MNTNDTERYQIAAQNVRTARSILSNLDDKSFSDYAILLGLGLVEEAMSHKHETQDND